MAEKKPAEKKGRPTPKRKEAEQQRERELTRQQEVARHRGREQVPLRQIPQLLDALEQEEQLGG